MKHENRHLIGKKGDAGRPGRGCQVRLPGGGATRAKTKGRSRM